MKRTYQPSKIRRARTHAGAPCRPWGGGGRRGELCARPADRGAGDRAELWLKVAPHQSRTSDSLLAECRALGIDYLYDPSQQVLRLEGSELARDNSAACW